MLAAGSQVYHLLPALAPNRCCARLQGEPVWQALLQFAVCEGLHSLVDCGALLAGTSNR